MNSPADRDQLLSELGRSDEVSITVTGRSSKKKRSTPVWFIVEGRKLQLVPVRGSETPWFRNLMKDPHILLSIGQTSVSSEATLLRDQKGAEKVLDKLRVKYRRMWSESYYPKHDAYVEVPL